jgi:hypothetical protein
MVFYLDFGPFIFFLQLFPCGGVFPLFIYKLTLSLQPYPLSILVGTRDLRTL